MGNNSTDNFVSKALNLGAFVFCNKRGYGAEYINGNGFKGCICKGAMSLMHKI